MTASDAMIYALHDNGIHVRCGRDCEHAGSVERFHSHDHDGPLVCDCDE
jgi:hypothetical protein